MTKCCTLDARWLVLRRSVMFALPFCGGNEYMLFISAPASALLVIEVPHVGSLYVFIITSFYKEPPHLLFHAFIRRWSGAVCAL